jgi:DNA polymerase III subunit epsilon
MRQIVLDTETTGLETEQGHRIIEIGALEIVNRRATGRSFQRYLNPERDIDEGASQVHGLTREFLAGQPRFAQIAAELFAFVSGAELVIHNAPFDIGFLDAEFARLPENVAAPSLAEHCRVLDTLALARQLHPGQRNSLDALCKRYAVDNSARELHGALLDAKLLSEVYLAMTGGQGALTLGGERAPAGERASREPRAQLLVPVLVIRATGEELAAHERALDSVARASGGACLFRESGVAA